MDKHDKVNRIEKGQPITAQRLNRMGAAINSNTSAVARPSQKDIPVGGSAEALADETFSATASDITTENAVVTDSNGDTHTNTRITQIVLTEDSTGRVMTLNIAYT